MGTDLTNLRRIMEKARVPGVTIANIRPGGEITATVMGRTDSHAPSANTKVTPDTVFGAASLSKPVFSYLVLKLIDKKKLTLPDGSKLGLDTPIYKLVSLNSVPQFLVLDKENLGRSTEKAPVFA